MSDWSFDHNIAGVRQLPGDVLLAHHAREDVNIDRHPASPPRFACEGALQELGCACGPARRIEGARCAVYRAVEHLDEVAHAHVGGRRRLAGTPSLPDFETTAIRHVEIDERAPAPRFKNCDRRIAADIQLYGTAGRQIERASARAEKAIEVKHEADVVQTARRMIPLGK